MGKNTRKSGMHNTLKSKTPPMISDYYAEVKKRNAPLKNIFASTEQHLLNEGYDEDKLHLAKGYGCFVEDYRGNAYIDTTFGAGTHILGYGHPLLAKEASLQFKEGTLFTVPTKYTYDVVERLSKILPQFDRFVFCNSGSESTMRAVRIARAYTERKKVAIFSGGWHGGNDLFLFEDDPRSDEKRPKAVLKSDGSPEELLKSVVMLPYNCDEAIALIEEHKNDLAMVMIEPSQGSNPRDDVGPFLKQLRDVTQKHGIVLCFDEIISGFRVTLGGCQEHYGIIPDMATYGKTLGGGLPIGLIAGKKKIMDVIKGSKPVFMGGTFSANPLTMRTCRTLLQYLVDHKKNIYPYLNENGAKMRKAVNAFCENKIAVRMMGIGSMSRLIFTDYPIQSRRQRDQFEASQDIQGRFYLHLLLENAIHVSSNRIIFLSMAHQKRQVDQIIKGIQSSLKHFSTDLQ
jgi:glutamate-1-semialdehyde aminotransferase